MGLRVYPWRSILQKKKRRTLLVNFWLILTLLAVQMWEPKQQEILNGELWEYLIVTCNMTCLYDDMPECFSNHVCMIIYQEDWIYKPCNLSVLGKNQQRGKRHASCAMKLIRWPVKKFGVDWSVNEKRRLLLTVWKEEENIRENTIDLAGHLKDKKEWKNPWKYRSNYTDLLKAWKIWTKRELLYN